MSQGLGSKITMKVVSIAVGIPVGIATKKTIARVWRWARPEDPSKRPDDPNVRWGDALGWAALSASGVAAAQLLSRRGAAATYRALTGDEPPPPKSAKSQKKAEKAAKKDHKKAARQADKLADEVSRA